MSKKITQEELHQSLLDIIGNVKKLDNNYLKIDNEALYIFDNEDIERALNVWKWNGNGLFLSNTGYNGKYNEVINRNGMINIATIKDLSIPLSKLAIDNDIPVIRLFDKCSIDASKSKGEGKGNAIRFKWDDYSYLYVSEKSISGYLDGEMIFNFAKVYEDSKFKFTFRDILENGIYHSMIIGDKVGLKFFSNANLLQVRNSDDNQFADLKANQISYNTLVNASDERLKENIKKIHNSDIRCISNENYDDISELDMYEFIRNIDLYNFDYIDYDNSNTFGFLAQELQNTKVGSRILLEDEDNNLGFNVYSLISILIGSMKQEIKKRDDEIKSIYERLEKLENLK